MLYWTLKLLSLTVAVWIGTTKGSHDFIPLDICLYPTWNHKFFWLFRQIGTFTPIHLRFSKDNSISSGKISRKLVNMQNSNCHFRSCVGIPHIHFRPNRVVIAKHKSSSKKNFDRMRSFSPWMKHEPKLNYQVLKNPNTCSLSIWHIS